MIVLQPVLLGLIYIHNSTVLGVSDSFFSCLEPGKRLGPDTRLGLAFYGSETPKMGQGQLTEKRMRRRLSFEKFCPKSGKIE